jgi:small subunit ribosomal protein S20
LVNPTGEKAAKAAVKSTSAEKAARGAIKRHQRNKAVLKEIKTDITRAEKLIFAGDVEAARAAVTAAVSALDKAAGKKMLHGNNAARRKSRLVKKLGQAKAKPQAAAKPEKPA